jgi:hypothetical protein
LLIIYQNVIYPFFQKYGNQLKNYSEWLQRIFYINGFNQSDGSKFGKLGYVGKSFVNSRNVDFMVNPHLPDGDRTDITDFFVSHFRDRYGLGNTDKSIRLFGIDLNYFFCYVVPFIKRKL